MRLVEDRPARPMPPELRVWMSAVSFAIPRTGDPIVRAVLLSLGHTACLARSMTVAPGVRDLAWRAGVSRSAAARTLNALCNRRPEHALAQLNRDTTDGPRRTYDLVVPSTLQEVAEQMRWPDGRGNGVRAIWSYR